MEAMEVDNSELRNLEKPTAAVAADGDVLPFVEPNECGIGYPYAPENWPENGDMWRWKVGSRFTKSDHHADRYLYAPNRLPKPRSFASRTSVERYIKKEFPNIDVKTFFSMFTWNIPAKMPIGSNTDEPLDSSSAGSSSDVEDGAGSKSQVAKCPAGKRFCNGLLLVDRNPTMPCNICCVEPDFCRHCCCILCNLKVRSAFGGYSYFRCEALVKEDYICGHVAHLECARKCFMAGTVGGLFDLNAAYYCRLCDARSDLVPHAMRILEIAKAVDRADLKKILEVGIFIMCGSKRGPAQDLCRLFEKAYVKLKEKIPLDHIWDDEDNLSAKPQSGSSKASIKTADGHNCLTTSLKKPEINSQQVDDQINNTLQLLKKFQDAE